MILSNLLADGEDEIICDLAETYHILNYQELPPDLVATLVIGLPDSSRIKKKYQKRKITLTEELLAMIVDSLHTYMWAVKILKKRPQSVYEILTAEPKEKDELQSFDTPEAYESWKKAKEEQWQCQK